MGRLALFLCNIPAIRADVKTERVPLPIAAKRIYKSRRLQTMYQTASYTEPNVSVSVVDRFATEPVTAIQVADEPLSEEELHTLFEQAMSDRLLAFGARLSRSSESLTTLSEMSGQRARTTAVESFPSTMPLKLSAGIWWSLMN